MSLAGSRKMKRNKRRMERRDRGVGGLRGEGDDNADCDRFQEKFKWTPSEGQLRSQFWYFTRSSVSANIKAQLLDIFR